MKKTAGRQNSRLVPQRPVKKERFSLRGAARNSYRRNRLKGKSPRSWRRLVLLVLGLLSLAGISVGLLFLYHQLLTCSLFCIKDIKNIGIDGNKRLTREVILQRAGLGPQTNLLALRPGRVERALLAHPWIARAELTRQWPQHIRIHIQERDPVALVQIGEELCYVDRQGVLFKPLSPGDPHNFPILTGFKPEHFRQVGGAMPEIVAQAFQLMEVLKHTPSPLNLENISEVHADLERGFTIYANGLGAGLELGFKDYSEKLKKFARLWPVLVQKGYLPKVGRINLNYPQRVLVTLKGTEDK
jgi:cell division protein FtsQ